MFKGLFPLSKAPGRPSRRLSAPVVTLGPDDAGIPLLLTYPGAQTIYLPRAGSCAGLSFDFVQTTANIGTLAPSSGTIGFLAAWTLPVAGYFISIQSDGANWIITRRASVRRVDRFNANGSWTCPAGVNKVRCRVQAAGGGGGGWNGSASFSGGSGAFLDFDTVVAPGTAYPLVVGVGGTVTLNAAGGTGGNSSAFGVTVSGGLGGTLAAHGTGGASFSAFGTAHPDVIHANYAGVAGAEELVVAVGYFSTTWQFALSTLFPMGANNGGGSSAWGAGGSSPVTNGDGSDGTANSGAGGGRAGNSGTDNAGHGAAGFIEVEWRG